MKTFKHQILYKNALDCKAETIQQNKKVQIPVWIQQTKQGYWTCISSPKLYKTD